MFHIAGIAPLFLSVSALNTVVFGQQSSGLLNVFLFHWWAALVLVAAAAMLIVLFAPLFVLSSSIISDGYSQPSTVPALAPIPANKTTYSHGTQKQYRYKTGSYAVLLCG